MKKLLFPLAFVLALVACVESSAPLDPVWGKQACGSCGMIVSDPRYATELVSSDGTHVFFDDPGCMATWLHDRNVSPKGLWVRSAAGTWTDARAARYVGAQKTPMDYGFAPTESGEAAWSDVEAAALRRLAPEGSHP
jgi:hypothetical protein